MLFSLLKYEIKFKLKTITDFSAPRKGIGCKSELEDISIKDINII